MRPEYSRPDTARTTFYVAAVVVVPFPIVVVVVVVLLFYITGFAKVLTNTASCRINIEYSAQNG